MGEKFRDQFQNAVNTVREEGRYRIFRDIRRKAGAFPLATWFKETDEKDITVWCCLLYTSPSPRDRG